jgi:hypothetical protein
MIEAFLLTIELWVFLGVLLTALVFESIIIELKRKKERTYVKYSRS